VVDLIFSTVTTVGMHDRKRVETKVCSMPMKSEERKGELCEGEMYFSTLALNHYAYTKYSVSWLFLYSD
jgi:hypothetical protein